MYIYTKRYDVYLVAIVIIGHPPNTCTMQLYFITFLVDNKMKITSNFFLCKLHNKISVFTMNDAFGIAISLTTRTSHNWQPFENHIMILFGIAMFHASNLVDVP